VPRDEGLTHGNRRMAARAPGVRRVSLLVVTITTAIGRHRFSRTGDLMRMTLDGPLTLADAEGMRAMMEATLSDGARCYLVADMSSCTGIESDARKYIVQWSRDGVQTMSGVAAYGLTFGMRTVVSLTMAAIKFLGKLRSPIVFAKTEAEALRWIETQRPAQSDSTAASAG
jgi:hypothetical protein